VKLQSVLQEGFQGTAQDSFTRGKKYALDVDLKVRFSPHAGALGYGVQ